MRSLYWLIGISFLITVGSWVFSHSSQESQQKRKFDNLVKRSNHKANGSMSPSFPGEKLASTVSLDTLIAKIGHLDDSDEKGLESLMRQGLQNLKGPNRHQFLLSLKKSLGNFQELTVEQAFYLILLYSRAGDFDSALIKEILLTDSPVPDAKVISPSLHPQTKTAMAKAFLLSELIESEKTYPGRLKVTSLRHEIEKIAKSEPDLLVAREAARFALLHWNERKFLEEVFDERDRREHFAFEDL